MLELKNITKVFENFSLKNISLTVKEGEYFVLLGRSGSGKSVIFEIIAGFKSLDSGNIILAGKDITNEKIQKRKIGFVFQDFAVFPHKTVRENIAYSLKKKKNKTEIKKIVNKYAKEMNIEHILDRKPESLSGGELQRTVLARTLASEPKILLLDEPLSSLDVQLSNEIRTLLKQLNKNGQTIIHITHDYDEAVRLADRVAIINKGKILQTGTIKEVFSRPKSKFTANFAGINNFFKVKLQEDKHYQTKIAVTKNNVKFHILTNESDCEGFLIIRSEDILLSQNFHLSSARNNFQGTVLNISPAQLGTEIVIDIGIKISAMITEESVKKMKIEEGKKIWVSFKASGTQFIKH